MTTPDMTQDFRTTPPDWYRYAINTTRGHDKYYEVRVDLLDSGLWQYTIRFGRRPDLGAGTIRPTAHPSMAIAIALANGQFDSKLSGGYVESERPEWANQKVRMDRQAF